MLVKGDFVAGFAGQRHLLLIKNDLKQYALVESGFVHLFSVSESLASKIGIPSTSSMSRSSGMAVTSFVLSSTFNCPDVI
jgi:hypothetical protein